MLKVNEQLDSPGQPFPVLRWFAGQEVARGSEKLWNIGGRLNLARMIVFKQHREYSAAAVVWQPLLDCAMRSRFWEGDDVLGIQL